MMQLHAVAFTSDEPAGLGWLVLLGATRSGASRLLLAPDALLKGDGRILLTLPCKPGRLVHSTSILEQ